MGHHCKNLASSLKLLFLVSVGKQSELHSTLNDPGWTTSVIEMQALVSSPDLELQAKTLSV